MDNVTLEKIDILRERCKISYGEAKEILQMTEGNVVDSLIYIEENKKSKIDEIYSSKDEMLACVKESIKKGNVNKIKIKKDGKDIFEIPVNSAVVAGLIAVAIPELFVPVIAIGAIVATVTKITIEITKTDGTVEIINRIIKDRMDDAKERFGDVKEKFGYVTKDVKDKFEDITKEVREKIQFNKEKESNYGVKDEENMYTYTVKFDDIDNENNK